MKPLRIAAVQFEHQDNYKEYNLNRIRQLTAQAVEEGAEVVSFHECSISAYSFVQSLVKEEFFELAERVPNGPSIQTLMQISKEYQVPILAGLFERDGDEVFNTYVCVDGDKLVAKFRKIHAFVNPHLSSGNEYCVFELRGWKCGILICYDNNIIENVRMTALMGADLIFMPHVTGCLPSAMPGRGLVDPKLWESREQDPVPLRMEFEGPKGRGWLMRWLPARAYDNGIYTVFTNPIGNDFCQIRNGNSMIFDPYGEVIAECEKLGDDICIGVCTSEKFETAGGRRYIRARRPELYGKMIEKSELDNRTLPSWDMTPPEDV